MFSPSGGGFGGCGRGPLPSRARFFRGGATLKGGACALHGGRAGAFRAPWLNAPAIESGGDQFEAPSLPLLSAPNSPRWSRFVRDPGVQRDGRIRCTWQRRVSARSGYAGRVGPWGADAYQRVLCSGRMACVLSGIPVDCDVLLPLPKRGMSILRTRRVHDVGAGHADKPLFRAPRRGASSSGLLRPQRPSVGLCL